MKMDALDLHRSPVLRPTAEATGLPNEFYVDEQLFRLERDQLFARGWTCVGVGAELPLPGDLWPIELIDMPLLMVRGRDGVVRVFHNVCSHRGVRLVDRPGQAPVIRCPYHSWAYDLEGRLVRTPDIGGTGIDFVARLAPAYIRMRARRMRHRVGFLIAYPPGG